MNPSARITASRTRLLLGANGMPFFGTILMHMTPVESTQHGGTMATDGRCLFYHPVFVNHLTDIELDAVMIHEAQHVALQHTVRFKRIAPGLGETFPTDPQALAELMLKKHRLNAAADYAVNQILHDAGVVLPDGCLLDKQYEGLSMEVIYERLPDENFPLQPGEVLCCPGNGSDAEVAAEQARLRDITVQAAAAASQRGDLPKELQRLVDCLTEAEVDWKGALYSWCRERTERDDTSWKRLNRRLLANGRVHPGMYAGESHGAIAFAVDTSGSITVEVLATFWAEMAAAVAACKPERVICIGCDAVAHVIGDWPHHDFPAIPPEFEGGGGTDFCPVFDLIEQKRWQVEGLVYLTDLEGAFPSSPPQYPVLWASVLPHTAPFGRVIHLGASS